MSEINVEWSAVDFINKTITRENGFTTTLIDAVEEVILQARQVKELEKEIERYKKFSGRMQLRNDNLAEGLQDRDEEIVRKNEALAFYADHDNFKTFDSPAIKDCGEKARQALKDVE